MNLKWNARRIVEPILLGTMAHVLINLIFSSHQFPFVFTEWVEACFLAIPITLWNKYLDSGLESRMSWSIHPRKRFMLHFALMAASLLIILNLFGFIYMRLVYHDFFSVRELKIINLVTMCLAVVLTLSNWAIQFYQRWIAAEKNAHKLTQEKETLQKKVQSHHQLIELQKGTKKWNTEAHHIRLARVEFDTIRVYLSPQDQSVFSGSLTQLKALLPEDIFFLVTRDAILHRNAIESTQPASFGKLEITIQQGYGNTTFTISRLKAATFRKWYNSSSPLKS